MNYVELTTNSPIDYAQLLHQCGNRPDVARQEIGLFLSQVASHVDELQSSFDIQEFDSVIMTAGAIKQSAQRASANLVSEAAGDIESAALSEDFSGALGAMPELQTQVIRLQEWMEHSTSSL